MADLPPLPLASATRIRALARTSIDAVLAIREAPRDWNIPKADYRARLNLLASALRFCAAAAGELGDPSLIDVVVAGIEVFPQFDWIEDVHVDGMAAGVTSLLRRGAPVTDGVVRLARHTRYSVRLAVAGGLRPTSDAELALLTELAADPSADIRTTARRSLDDRAPLPWWLGKWSRDPAEIAPDEVREHDGAARAIATILDARGYEVRQRLPELVALATKLPDALAVDLAEGLLCSIDAAGFFDAAIPTLLLSRPPGRAAPVRLLHRWGDNGSVFYGRPWMIAALLALSPEERAPIVRDLVRMACAAMPEQPRGPLSAPAVAAEIAAKVWAEGEDTEPVLDALLAFVTPERGFDSVKLSLAPLLARPPRDPSRMRDRALEARRAGYPGALAGLRHQLEALLAALGEASVVDGGS